LTVAAAKARACLFDAPEPSAATATLACETLQVDGEIDTGQRLVEIVDVEKDVVLRRDKGAEVHQMAVAARLHRNSSHRLGGKVCRHDGGGPRRNANGLSDIRA
jgi:hypothetical protein